MRSASHRDRTIGSLSCDILSMSRPTFLLVFLFSELASAKRQQMSRHDGFVDGPMMGCTKWRTFGLARTERDEGGRNDGPVELSVACFAMSKVVTGRLCENRSSDCGSAVQEWLLATVFQTGMLHTTLAFG